MKFIIFPIAIIFFISCAATPDKVTEGVEERVKSPTFLEKLGGQSEDATIFATAYGDISEGSSMPDVMYVLGNPHHISCQEKNELWYYNFGKDKNLFVYFINGKVVGVKDKQE